LAAKLEEYKGKENAYVLAIPAGGVQVAFVAAKRLKLPLDLVITRKIHVPWNKEAGFGAILWDGMVFLNEPLVASLGLTKEDIDRCVTEEKEVIRRRLEMFRGNRPFPDLKNKTAIIIDDGLASGFSMLTTVEAIKRSGVKEIIVAVPTAPISAIKLNVPHADKIVCLNIRSGPFFAVADAYKTWYDLEDEDVAKILKLAWLNQ
jgi:predicted phosphoribosyltransferase